METLGYLASLFIGIALGLIGGGGSILTVPVLVYLFHLQPVLATSYSLFVVGSTSLVGAYQNFQKGLVHLKAALFFGVSSITTVFLTRRFLMPLVPKTIRFTDTIALPSSLLTMLLFAALMLAASIAMIRSKKAQTHEEECLNCVRFARLTTYGIAIGLITGLLGAGGGFLLIPSLIFLLKLPMKKAVGTSLLIIALNSLIGFVGDVGHVPINWTFLFTITAIAIAGIFIGFAVGKRLASEGLKKGFGWFVLVMGIYIILKETILK